VDGAQGSNRKCFNELSPFIFRDIYVQIFKKTGKILTPFPSMTGILRKRKIAYFSMEIGLSRDIPTYSGGLGILAGDTIKSSADLNLPLVALTLISRRGYFRQELDSSGNQIEHPVEWNPSDSLVRLQAEATVQIQNRDVKVGVWQYSLQSPTGGMVPVLFLDTDLEGNSPDDRTITHYLYGGSETYRLKQEMILGIGGVRILDSLGFEIRRYHMNEGHSGLLTLELLKRYAMDTEAVKELCVFTTHTPVEAGHDKFDYSLVDDLMGDFIDASVLKKFGGVDRLNMTYLALNLSNYINGVAKRHRTTSMEMFPGYKINSVTNGVHSFTWTCPCFRKLFDKYMPGWANEPEMLLRVDSSPDGEIWEAHIAAKRILIDYVNKETGVDMDYESLTIGFARRAAEYKRITFLFSDLERLRRANHKGRIQVVLAGKAHPRDEEGKKAVKKVFELKQTLKDEIRVAYLQNYDMDLALKMVSGADVWLNTPLPPQEASGTSGMKAAHNGVINFGVLDGWWIEGWIEGVTGWSIGPEPGEKVSYEEARNRELEDFYGKLEHIIIPMFYHRRDEWIGMMNNSIGMVASFFNSHRMMRRYVTEAYL
jgi:glycogen phosphorylase